MSNRKVPPKGNAFMNYLGVFVLFAAAIVCFVAAWFYGGNHSSFGAKPSETTGVVTRVDELKVGDFVIISVPFVTYEVKGITYETPITSFFDGAKEGDEYTLYYNYMDPYDADVKKPGGRGFNMIYLLGGVLAGAGIALLIVAIRGGKDKQLSKKGVCIKTIITDKEVGEIRINGVNTHRIKCRVIDFEPGVPQEFVSGLLHGEDSIQVNVGDMLPVYVNPKKPSAFFMDFAHVEKNVGLDALYQNEV